MKKMKCKLCQLLFRIVPLPAWQDYLLDKHFSKCSHCRGEVTTDDQVREMLVSPQNTKTLPSIWPYVHKHMDETGYSLTGVPGPKKRWITAILPGWQWKVAIVGIFLILVLLLFPFLHEKKSTLNIIHTGIGAADKVMIKSIKIDSKATKFYFFESKDPDKVIVWAERK
jgi:hypothetical protein